MNSLQTFPAQQERGGVWREVEDVLIVEEPLEIRVGGRRYSATMRTPQNAACDRFLALGLLLGEGVISHLDDVENVEVRTRCRDLSDELVNVVDVTLHDESLIPSHAWERSIVSNASCGLCGKASVEALSTKLEPLETAPIDAELLRELPNKMRARQTLFEASGGLHAAAIFDSTGEWLACFEDIGRHNALDKAIGFGLENDWIPAPRGAIVLMSGRVSFEIVQKALRARIGTVAAVSAASSLAVELSTKNNLNLVGFLRPRGMTIYSGEIG